MKIIDYEALLQFARTLAGQTLKTARFGDEFTLTVRDGGFEYTPLSGHAPIFHDAVVLKCFLKEFNDAESLEPADYRDTPVNDGYFLVVVDHYLQSHREISQWPEPILAVSV